MKKYNFLSKAALLVAPFALAATFGAANAHADSQKPTEQAVALDGNHAAPVQSDGMAPTVKAAGLTDNNGATNADGNTYANVSDMESAFNNNTGKDMSVDYNGDSDKAGVSSNTDPSAKDWNKHLGKKEANNVDQTKTLEYKLTHVTLNGSNKSYDSDVNTSASSKDGNKFNLLSAVYDSNKGTTDDKGVAMADAMANNAQYLVKNVSFNNNVDGVYAANLKYAASVLADYTNKLNDEQNAGENVSKDLAYVQLQSELVNNLLDSYNKTQAYNNSANVNGDVAAEAKAQEDAVAADYAQVQAEAKAAAEAANKAKKPAKKPAKKHARKHARKFTVRVKAHKIYAYKSANFRRHAGRKAEKRGKKLVVYGVIKKGHKTYYRVFGHRVITANKHFVKRV